MYTSYQNSTSGADSKRDAYKDRSLERSKALHSSAHQSEENHPIGGEFIKSIVFGGLDGMLTSFAVVCAAAGGEISSELVLILGISSVCADAIAMGLGNYFSSKAHRDFVLSEEQRERWELRNFKEGEIQEIADIFTLRGMKRTDAEMVVRTMANYDEFFVRLMLTEELGHSPPASNETLINDGVSMFLSFLVFGMIPMVVYILDVLFQWKLAANNLFISSIIVTSMGMIVLGALKSMYSTQEWYRSSGETLLIGAVCAASAYGISALVNTML